MIKFFRKIRQKLLSENKFTKYLIYAFGEIVLVVIGILIALSINNWNEGLKDKKLEEEYLIGIKEDLIQDLSFIESNIPVIEIRLTHYKDIDSTVINYNNIQFREVSDTILNPKYFVYPQQSFRPKIGTYSALISEGKTGYITNRILFNKIQDVYEIHNARIEDANSYIDSKSKDIMWEYRNLLLYDDSDLEISELKNPEFIASLNYIQEDIARYVRLLKQLKGKINDVIVLIDEELVKK